MNKLITPIIALIAAAGIAACGSTGGSNATAANGPATTSGSSGTVTATATAPSSSGTSVTKKQVATQADHVLSRLASTTNRLANGQLTAAQARPQLQRLHSQALTLESDAKQLPATTPARPVLLTIGTRAASYATQLQNAHLSSRAKQQLHQSSKALTSLEAQINALIKQNRTPSLNQITSDLQTLTHNYGG